MGCFGWKGRLAGIFLALLAFKDWRCPCVVNPKLAGWDCNVSFEARFGMILAQPLAEIRSRYQAICNRSL